MTAAPRTLYDKIFQDHLVNVQEDGTALIYIDRHIVHEVTSPQAFEGLKKAGRPVRRPDCTLTTVDHNIPTSSRKTYKSAKTFVEEPQSRTQVLTLEQNVKDFGLTYFGLDDERQGIVHIIGPEQGFTIPGTTIVCGDSHTSTHGAFGALAFGIGTSEVEHVLATQTLLQAKAKNMRIRVSGELTEGVTAKDIILHVIGVIGTAFGTGHVIEFCGSTIENLSMEGRMSICNMSIEAGARAGMVAPDETTFKYLAGRPLAPKGAEWDAAVNYWKSLKTDENAHFDSSVDIDAKDIHPTVSWGTSPQDVVSILGTVPDPDGVKDSARAATMRRSLEYMGLVPGTKMEDIPIDKVFIGSCTNSRIEDLRSAAKIAAGRKVAKGVYAMIVPGSGLVKHQAEREGLDKIFIDAGFDWREAGCSMCLGMNPDQLKAKERCASTSNRNFEGRQGPGGRTHLVSPAMAAAAAVHGHFIDVRKVAIGSEASHIGQSSGEPVIAVDNGHAAPKLNENKLVDDVNDSVGQSSGAPAVSALEGSAAGLPKLTTINAIAAPLRRSNVDTDQIIPAKFLKTVLRSGLGPALFNNLRYDANGKEIPEFVLNKEPFRNAEILVVTGPNFGCGSSREHAPWALLDFGIRVVICSSYADIFFNNMFKNGMLPIVLSQEQVDILAEDAEKGLKIEIDLPKQIVRRPSGEEFTFTVNDFRKQCLINGWDDISLTLKLSDTISTFEDKRTANWPWLDGIGYKKRAGNGPVEIPVSSSKVGAPSW